MTKAILKITCNLGKQIIKYIDYPLCKDCIYYYPTNSKIKGASALCKKFGKKNIFDGTIQYERVVNVREDFNMCGEKGNYFVKRTDSAL
jgi:hypothetical protein